MATHVCRDLLIGGSNGWASGSTDSMWALSVFLQGVLGYVTLSAAGAPQPPGYADFSVAYYSASISPFSLTQVSSSIVSIHTPSCFVTSSGTHTLLQFSTDVVNLQKAAYPVGWPSGSGPWPQGDPLLGDWIALRSNAAPAANSGIFAVTDSTNYLSGNAVAIDYRTTSPAVQETGALLTASIWLPPPSSDISTAPGRGQSRTGGGNWALFNAMAGNGNSSGYQGQGSATVPRLLLQSPGPLAWQLRLCVESTPDATYGGAVVSSGPRLTAFPGFSGSAGDYPTGTLGMPGAMHLHVMQRLNVSFAAAPDYVGCLPALDAAIAAVTGSQPFNPTFKLGYRFYAWGDDVTGTCLVAVRNSVGAADAYMAFGQAEAEVLYPGQCAASRLFTVGQATVGPGLTWANGTFATFKEGITGLSYCTDARFGPLACTVSSWSFAADQFNDSNSIRFDATAADTPFLGATEVIESELVAGAWDNLRTPGNTIIFPMEPRQMGRFPFARFGRATGQSAWSTGDTLGQWFHASNGFYLPWGGLASLP